MISAIILAAGLSKRMELGNKLLLEKKKLQLLKLPSIILKLQK